MPVLFLQKLTLSYQRSATCNYRNQTLLTNCVLPSVHRNSLRLHNFILVSCLHQELVSFGLRDMCCSSLEPVPAVKTPLTTVEVVPGGDAVFTLDLTTTCSGTWYLNGKVLQESETYIIKRTQTTHTLIIKNVTKNDDGAEVKFVANSINTSTKMRVKGMYFHQLSLFLL